MTASKTEANRIQKSNQQIMCGRYVLHTPASTLAERYWNYRMPVGDMVARYNITPGTQIYAVRLQEDGEPLFDLSYWGFKPAWAAEKAPTPINARIESLKSSYFREAFKNYRCVMPASGWYEWVKTDDGKKKPYYITCSALERGDALMFGGIYTPTGVGTGTRAAIITEPAAEGIRHLHDRQPVLIHPDSLSAWLNPLQDVHNLKGKIKRTAPETLEWWRVSDQVNRPENNDKTFISPL